MPGHKIVIAVDDGHDIDDNMCIEKHIDDIKKHKAVSTDYIYQLEGPWPALVALKIKKSYEAAGLTAPHFLVSDKPYDSHITDPAEIMHGAEARKTFLDPEFKDLTASDEDKQEAQSIIAGNKAFSDKAVKDPQFREIMEKSCYYIRKNNIKKAGQINELLDGVDSFEFFIFSGLSDFAISADNQKKARFVAMQGQIDREANRISGFNFSKFLPEAQNKFADFLFDNPNIPFFAISLSNIDELKVDGSKERNNPLHYAYFRNYVEGKKYGWLVSQGDPTTVGVTAQTVHPFQLLPQCEFPCNMHFFNGREFGLNRFKSELSGKIEAKETLAKEIAKINDRFSVRVFSELAEETGKDSENLKKIIVDYINGTVEGHIDIITAIKAKATVLWKDYKIAVTKALESSQCSCDMIAFDLAAQCAVEAVLEQGLEEAGSQFDCEINYDNSMKGARHAIFIDNSNVKALPDLLESIHSKMSCVAQMKPTRKRKQPDTEPKGKVSYARAEGASHDAKQSKESAQN